MMRNVMTNDVVDWSKKVAPSAIYERKESSGLSRFFMDQWEKMVPFKASRSLENALCRLWHLGF